MIDDKLKEKLEGCEDVKIKEINDRDVGSSSMILEVDGVEILVGCIQKYQSGHEIPDLQIDYNKAEAEGL